jgi:hypothetical protein
MGILSSSFFFNFFKKEEETEYSGIEVKENSGSRLQNNAFEYISHLTVNSVIVIIMFTLKKNNMLHLIVAYR